MTEIVLFRHRLKVGRGVHLEALWVKLFLDRRFSDCKGPEADAYSQRMRNSQEARRRDGLEMGRLQTLFRALAASKHLGCDSEQ